MKKFTLLAAFAFCSVLSFAQPGTELNETANDSTKTTAVNSQDRIAILEKEVAALKETNSVLQKEIAEIKTQLPFSKKGKKQVISRTGSKQGVWVDQ